MSLIWSSGIVLSTREALLVANQPAIGWRTLVTAEAVAASSETAARPAGNLANPSTAQRWQAAAPGGATVTIDTSGSVDLLDYVGIARHNFGTAGIGVTLEALDESQSPAVWSEIVQETLPADDSPLMLRFQPLSARQLRLRFSAGSAPVEAAVLYVGTLLILPRRIYVGHTPINYGRSQKTVTGRSESGNYLGRIVLSETLESAIEVKDMDPAWYRREMDPFVAAAREAPFFFAWRPQSYPREVGFCWVTDDPQPSNSRSNGMMDIGLSIAGIGRLGATA